MSLKTSSKGEGSPHCHWYVIFDVHREKTLCGCAFLDMPDSREMTVQKTGGKSYHRKRLTCGHKAKDITPSIAWRREA